MWVCRPKGWRLGCRSSARLATRSLRVTNPSTPDNTPAHRLPVPACKPAQPRRGYLVICEHVWAFGGALLPGDPRAELLVCQQPNVLRCKLCAEEVVVKCGSASSEACEPCGVAHRGRVTVVAYSGLRRRPVPGRRLAVSPVALFLTLTAPGVRQHHPYTVKGGQKVWDNTRWCRCTPALGTNLAKWNGASGKAFNRLMQDLRRLPGLDDVVYVKAAEVQRRGALHFHVILRRRAGGVLAMDLERVGALAIEHGFGHEVDLQKVEPRHGAYIAKYAAKAANQRPDVPWCGRRRKVVTVLDEHTGELVDHHMWQLSLTPTYRTWTASRAWGDSMKAVRLAQGHYVEVLRALPAWDERPVLGARFVRRCPARPDGPPLDPP